jgi:hypothetical protein
VKADAGSDFGTGSWSGSPVGPEPRYSAQRHSGQQERGPAIRDPFRLEGHTAIGEGRHQLRALDGDGMGPRCQNPSVLAEPGVAQRQIRFCCISSRDGDGGRRTQQNVVVVNLKQAPGKLPIGDRQSEGFAQTQDPRTTWKNIRHRSVINSGKLHPRAVEGHWLGGLSLGRHQPDGKNQESKVSVTRATFNRGGSVSVIGTAYDIDHQEPEPVILKADGLGRVRTPSAQREAQPPP